MLLRLLPALRSFHGSLPLGIEYVALIGAHLRLECAVDGPLLGHFLLAAPEACRQAGEVSGTQGGGLSNLLPLHSHPEDVCLELHEQVIDDGTPINTQGTHMDAAVSGHRFQHITGLVAHGFKCRASNIGLSLIHISEPTRLGMISYAVF